MDNFPIFVGEGNGGKSLFYHKLTVISGPMESNKDKMLEFFKGAYASDEMGELSIEFLKKGGICEQKLEKLEGKKLVFIKDFDLWDQVDGGLLKTIDGGESYYDRTDDLNSGSMKKINSKIVITSSKDPKIVCTDKSLLNRLNIIHC